MKKRIIALSLIIIAIICAASGTALASEAGTAESGNCGTNLTWSLDTAGILTISGTGEMTAFTSDSEIPWYDSRSTVKTIVIEEGVTGLADYAFAEFGSLKSVSLPTTLKSIGSFTFAYCYALPEITIPSGVEVIGDMAFHEATGLTGIHVSTGNASFCSDGSVLYSKDMIRLIFCVPTYTGTLDIPSSVDSIHNAAFYNCTGLTGVTLPEGLEEIGAYAFDGAGIVEIEIPASVSVIGEYAFCNYVGTLTGIWVDAENQHFSSDESGVLFNKDRTTLIAGPSTLTGAYEIPDSVSRIESEAFAYCDGLSKVTIPDSVAAIGANAFYECTSLTRLTIPASVTSIEEYAFIYCFSLSDITFLGSAPEFGENPFLYVTASVHYPSGNTSWTSDVMQNYGGSLTWTPLVSTVIYDSASLSLAGDIGVNYYVQLSDDIVADEGAYMQFTVAGESQTVPLSEAVVGTNADGITTYRFSCKVAAKQMTETIVGQMYTSNGAVGEAREYSVKAYCDAAIPVYGQYEAYADLVALMEAMLNYGAYSQVQFSYNTNNLANAGLEEIALPELTEADVSAYAHGAAGSEKGIRIASVSLLLESATTIRFYFTVDGTKDISEYTFYVDGVETTPVQSGNQYYVDKVSVAAKELDEMVTVTVGGLTVKYGGLSYVRQVAVLYPTYYSNDLVNVAKALYAYNQAANAYFG